MKYLLTIGIIFLCFASNGQPMQKNKLPATSEMVLQVKQFAQFIERFNYTKTPDDKPIDDNFKNKISRPEYIMLLFNETDPRIDSTQPKYNSHYRVLRREFIKKVCADNLGITPEMKDVYSVAKCVGEYKNTQVAYSVVLRKNVLDNGASEWIIHKINADFLLPKQMNEQRTIPPNAGETGFMKLADAFSDKDNLSSYFGGTDPWDATSIFLYEIHRGAIKHKFSKEVTYYIFAIPDWVVVVKNFQRNTTNSGWLIDDVLPISKTEINNFIDDNLK